MSEATQDWRWGLAMVALVERLRREDAAFDLAIDQHIIPPFDGSPDGIFVWLITRTPPDVEALKARAPALRERIAQAMRHAAFPESAIGSCELYFTFESAISAGGGKFYYFR